MGNPTSKELRNVRDRFEELLLHRSLEDSFQTLFKECPYILSRSLPVRLEPTQIIPLGRPGKSEADFVFYPQTKSPIPTFGVIELKRPDTKLLTEPRKGITILTRDARTAVAQAQEYSRQLKRDLISSFRTSLIIGNKAYTFIIAGLTDELTTRALSGKLFDGLDSLVPSGCQIIPYDSIFERYASSIPPLTMMLTPLLESKIVPLDTLVQKVSEGERTQGGISDETMDFWIKIEEEWRSGNYIGTKRKIIIDRKYWCIQGTEILATESPAHLDFPVYVQSLIKSIRSSAWMHNVLENVAANGVRLDNIRDFLSTNHINLLSEAVQRCQKNGYKCTWFYPIDENIDFLEQIGLIRFYNHD